MQNLDLFPHLLPRAPKRRVVMHVSEGDLDGPGRARVKLLCRNCGTRTGWQVFESASKARQGVPCKICNAERLPPSDTKMPSAKECLQLNLAPGR